MRYHFFRLDKKDDVLDTELIEGRDKLSDYDIITDDELEAFQEYAEWLDENNENPNDSDTYHCAAVDENNEITYFTVRAYLSRDVYFDKKQ